MTDPLDFSGKTVLVTRIFGGTNEIMKEVISRSI